jgi:cystathionine beta-synthase
VLAAKGGELPILVHVHPEESVQSVIKLLREFEVSQVPVVKAEPPLAAAEVVGSVQDRDLLEAAFHDPTLLSRPVGEVMGPPLPTVGSGAPLELTVARMERSGAVVVLDAGHPVGIITRSDVLGAMLGRQSR